MTKTKKTIKGKKGKNISIKTENYIIKKCKNIYQNTKKRQLNSIYKNKKQICCSNNLDYQKNKSITSELYNLLNSNSGSSSSSKQSLLNSLLLINKHNIQKYKDFKEITFYNNEKQYLTKLKTELQYSNKTYIQYNIKAKALLNNIKSSNKIYLDNSICEFINTVPNNCKIILLHPNCNNKTYFKLLQDLDKIKNDLHNNNTNVKLICHKNIELSFNAICSLNYMINSYEKLLTLSDVQKLSNIQGYHKRNSLKNGNYICKCLVFYYENANANKNTDHKINLVIKKLLNTRNATRTATIISNNITDISKTLFNWNSLNFLEEQLLFRFIKIFSTSGIGIGEGYKFINNIKNYFTQNINVEDRERFMITGGGMIYIYGLRRPHDLDFFINKYPTKLHTLCLNELINNDFINDDTKVEEWDAVYPPLKWKDFYTTYHAQWAESVGGKSMLQCMINPVFHFYYMGLKFILLDLEIYRRNTRGRPAAVADIIAINKLLNKNIKINKIDKKVYIMYPGKEEVDLVTVDSNKFLSTVKFKLLSRFGIKKTTNELKHLIKFK